MSICGASESSLHDFMPDVATTYADSGEQLSAQICIQSLGISGLTRLLDPGARCLGRTIQSAGSGTTAVNDHCLALTRDETRLLNNALEILHYTDTRKLYGLSHDDIAAARYLNSLSSAAFNKVDPTADTDPPPPSSYDKRSAPEWATREPISCDYNYDERRLTIRGTSARYRAVIAKCLESIVADAPDEILAVEGESGAAGTMLLRHRLLAH